MLKKCFVLDGEIINIGEWDFSCERKVIKEEVRNKFGEIIEEREYLEVPRNPLPEGAIEEEREFTFSEEHGWAETGKEKVVFDVETYLLDLEFRTSLLEITGGMK